MDESNLLEECVNISLTPLQTLLLSETIHGVGTLVKFLYENNCMEIIALEKDSSEALPSEQTGNILIQSALSAMSEVSSKIWEKGTKEFGEEMPEEFVLIVSLYSTLLQQISTEFIKGLIMKQGED